MHCPNCNATDTKVIDSRLLPEGQAVRRRRKCESCLDRFTTYEKMLITLPMILKHDKRRESFNREKLVKGLKKACQKRPITASDIDKLIDDLEQHLLSFESKEVPSEKIGEYLMERLLKLDPVAYVRFASFYWNFTNIEDFVSSLSQNISSIKGNNSEQLRQ